MYAPAPVPRRRPEIRGWPLQSRHFAGLNSSLDTFLARALARNLPLRFINYAAGAHAFELDEDTDTSRDIVRQTLEFLQFHLENRDVSI